MEVNVYVKKQWSGNFSGDGKAVALIEFKDKKGKIHSKQVKEAVICSTKNELELRICISALRALKKKCKVNIYIDSGYMKSAFRNKWVEAWKNNDWKRKNGETIANVKGWRLLNIMLEMHEVSVMDYEKKYDEQLKAILDGKEKENDKKMDEHYQN